MFGLASFSSPFLIYVGTEYYGILRALQMMNYIENR